MRISKTTQNAVKILTVIARKRADLVKVAEIADALGLPEQNTFKISHLLSRAGFVKAVRGPHGGLMLAKPASDIGIGDVVIAMERMSLEEETGRPGSASRQGLSDILDSALEAFVSVLNEHTLDDLARGSERGRSGRDERPSATADAPAKRKRGEALRTTSARRKSPPTSGRIQK